MPFLGYSLILILGLSALLNACGTYKTRHFPALIEPSSMEDYRFQQQWAFEFTEPTSSQDYVLIGATDKHTLVVLNTLGQRLATFELGEHRVGYEQVASHPALQYAEEISQCWQLSYPRAQTAVTKEPKWSVQHSGLQSWLYFSGILRASIELNSQFPNAGDFRCDFDQKRLKIRVSSEPI